MQKAPHIFVLFALGVVACASNSERDGNAGYPTTMNPATNTDAGAGAGMSQSDSGGNSSVDVDPCPDARPVEGTTCQVSTSTCTYDEIECSCPSGVWSCEEPVDPGCPATTPTSGSSCSLAEGTECDYLQVECECLSGVWECASEDDEEDAGVTPDPDASLGCPELRPVENTACEAGAISCTNESTKCVCPAGLWSCSEPVTRGCPATAPLHGDPCVGFADCDFLEVECECRRGAWACKPND
jgi:hypothetical protein